MLYVVLFHCKIGHPNESHYYFMRIVLVLIRNEKVHYPSLGVPSPLCILDLSRPIHMDMEVKTQLYLCNIQGVSVCTNVSANYMFRPPPVSQSSGWT